MNEVFLIYDEHGKETGREKGLDMTELCIPVWPHQVHKTSISTYRLTQAKQILQRVLPPDGATIYSFPGPLYAAICTGDLEALKLLIELGVPDTVDGSGQSPVEYAKNLHQDQAMQILKTSGYK